MPVTKTAKRALRGSARKGKVNAIINASLDKAIRIARKTSNTKDIDKAASLADRAVKKYVIHKNKAGRIKSALSKLQKPSSKKVKKTSK